MWMWTVGPAMLYLTVAFVVFKNDYAKERADTFARLAAAKHNYKEELAAAKAKYLKENPTRNPNHVSVDYSDVRKFQNWVDTRIDLPGAIFSGAFWPLMIFKWFGKFMYLVLFGGDIDRAAKKKAKVLIAQQTAEREQQKEEARLLALAKEEGLISDET